MRHIPRVTGPVRRRIIAGFLLASLGTLPSCVTPATEIFVVLGTDVPESVPLVIKAHVRRAGRGTSVDHQWTRGAGDGGITLPASFAVTPGDSPLDLSVTIDIEGTAGSLVLHRRAAVTYTAHESVALRIFLTTRCLQPATGCQGAHCTVQALCEEMNLTCGNDGTCVSVNAPVVPGRDASFGDIATPPPCGGYHEPCCIVGADCDGAMSCVEGRCQRCTDTAEACCNGPDLLPDRTVCAPTLNPCQSPGLCTRGVCGAITDLANGMTCSTTTNPCQRGGTCTAGVCSGATNVADGTVCGAAPDACHRAPVCTAGSCGAAAMLPDGTPWGAGGINRCCSGVPAQVNTTANCNACGWRCGAGESCYLRNGYQYYCTCTTSGPGGNCPVDQCCSTFYGRPYACAASDCAGGCAACPGHAVCTVDTSGANPNVCHY